MTFDFNRELARQYHSRSQISRVLTEDWLERNVFCPVCGAPYINRYKNNHPVGDFYCEQCASDFELKSKENSSGRLSNTITDGEYGTMIERITSFRNPNFFFITYTDYSVINLVVIPNHFFTPEIIIKRKPLGPNARRAGWTGCTIDISSIPESGKIFMIKNRVEINRDTVLSLYAKTKALRTESLECRGWLLDTLACIDRIREKDFSLNQVYEFERELKKKHPDNNFIKDKIRQQLQVLRDKNFIEFIAPGRYRKL
ncbi:restriction endonuclease [Treponema sp. OMZ 840]|uniref:DpnI domain-containing protein n=1 Tax=Treponema sp. OMZ 840 TaxID=244313 RepID=UPI003D8D2364